ncbi:MAG: hypothetical protein ABFC71_00260 [Methanoregula sp.]
MSRGPRPRRALSDAVIIAQQRGTVQQHAGNAPESLYDFAIVGTTPVAFVRVKFAARILETISHIAEDFQDEIRRLRAVARDAAISLELWLRSRHGTWRFFRVTGDGLAELDRNGRPLA